ncbi:MAG: sigma-70 family RNA polymerase sigma factor [Armatimonadetes bacterium]|nr:sigma-70 family RNA polymerase sigma factor [Armatimonadota bacterium]
MSEGIPRQKDDGEQLVVQFLDNPRDDLKDLIIVQYSPMVERIARRFKGLEHEDDLVQVGYIGLLNALSKFDPSAGVRFNTYATHLVAGEIKHYLRDRSQTIRQPAWLQELRHKVHKAATMLHAVSGEPPSEREIAETIGVSESAVREVIATQELLRVGSLDMSMGDDEDGESDVDKLDAAVFEPDQLSVEERVVLDTAMQQLRDLERQVLVLFHFDALSQTEIANLLGISCNYVSHILRQSLAKLRRILTSEDELDRILQRGEVQLSGDVLDLDSGVYNERYFLGRLTEEIHRIAGSNETLSVVIVKFDGLESLASFYGDQSVRDFLTDAANLLKDVVRNMDIVCRVGDVGFGVILPATGASVEIVSERLGRKFGQWLAGRVAPNRAIIASIGYATVPDDGSSVADLLAKAAGRSSGEKPGPEQPGRAA